MDEAQHLTKDLLRKVNQAVDAAPTLSDALDTYLAHLKETIPCDGCALFLCDDDAGAYVLVATDSVPVSGDSPIRVKYGEGLVGFVAEKEALLNEPIYKEHDQYIGLKRLDDSSFETFLGVPIIDDGELQGVAVLYREDITEFSDEQCSIGLTLTINLAGLIARGKAKGDVAKLLAPKRRSRYKNKALSGLPGAPGIAVGKGVLVFPEADLDAVPDREISDVDKEIDRFDSALKQAREEMMDLHRRAKDTFSAAESAIFDAYLRILDSRSFSDQVHALIEEKQWAEGALRRVIKAQAAQFEALDDAYLSERADDLLDLGRRVLFFLQEKERETRSYPENTVLVGEALSVTTLLEVPHDRLVGIVSKTGSANAHVAILARALGVPAVMGMEGVSALDFSNKTVIVDGYYGQVYVSPSRTLKEEFIALSQEEVELDADLASLKRKQAKTTDGHRVQLLVNAGLTVDQDIAKRVGAEGVGLYRSEMLFMQKERFPTENEQYEVYRELVQSFPKVPITMRTLDIGGDKILPYFPIEEDNPFLGWRGVRVTLDHPEIFLQQVRAMIRASEGHEQFRMMLPMVMSLSDVEDSLRLIMQAHQELVESGLDVEMPAVGTMVEVPAAVYQSEELAKRLSFLSVGSNDLTQHILAIDRNNSRVADLYDSLHPAVLRALKQVVKAGHRAGKPVGICGEMCSDPLAVILLLALGFDSLSMNARILPRMKWVIRSFSLEEAQALLKEALSMHDPKEVRELLEGALDAAGLGGLIRAGRQ